MREIIAFFLLAALLAVAFKIAVLLLLLAGLIFRTEATISLLVISAIIAGFVTHPIIGIALLATALTTSLYFKRREARQAKGTVKLLR
jgi:hypothetical protein